MAVEKVKKSKAEKAATGRVVTAQSHLNQSAEQSRLNVRLSSVVKERIIKAAALRGQDLTEFAVAALSEKANHIIEQHNNLLLGTAEYDFFLNALTDSSESEPSERSRNAAEKYRQGTRKGVRYILAD